MFVSRLQEQQRIARERKHNPCSVGLNTLPLSAQRWSKRIEFFYIWRVKTFSRDWKWTSDFGPLGLFPGSVVMMQFYSVSRTSLLYCLHPGLQLKCKAILFLTICFVVASKLWALEIPSSTDYEQNPYFQKFRFVSIGSDDWGRWWV